MATSRSSFLLLLLIPLLLFMSSVDRVDATGCLDPCTGSYATSAAGVAFACPNGDGTVLGSAGLTISVRYAKCPGIPVPGIPASDIWVEGCHDLLTLCGGRGISASGPTDDDGRTTITGSIAAGGCDSGGLRVFVQGVAIGGGVCADPCVPITVKSADLNGNLEINLVDFASFGTGYTSPPKPYNECLDFTSPFGAVSLSDFAVYGSHNHHSC